MLWYEDEIRHLEELPRNSPGSGRKVVFYGSSSIRLWTTLAQDFDQIRVVNLGFGGSTLAACAWFFERLVVPFRPDALILYAGDNDLGDGRHPEEVYLFFQVLYAQVRRHLGNIPFTFISVKPSPARWHIIDRVRYVNQLIQQYLPAEGNNHFVDLHRVMLDEKGNPRRELFAEDGLHLSRAGYQLWQQELLIRQDKIF